LRSLLGVVKPTRDTRLLFFSLFGLLGAGLSVAGVYPLRGFAVLVAASVVIYVEKRLSDV